MSSMVGRLALTLALLLPCAAYAGTDSDTMTVTATVIDSCDINAADLEFGDYDPVSSTPLDGEADITVTCTNGTAYEIAIDEGAGTGASIGTRKMTRNVTNHLNYSLYRNSQRTNVWGETTGSNTVTGAGSGSAQTLTVYGRVNVNQTSIAGGYTDTVTVLISY